MKFLDEVKVIKDRDEYTQHNILQKWWGYYWCIDKFLILCHIVYARVKDENFMSDENYIFSLKDDIIYPI